VAIWRRWQTRMFRKYNSCLPLVCALLTQGLIVYTSCFLCPNFWGRDFIKQFWIIKMPVCWMFKLKPKKCRHLSAQSGFNSWNQPLFVVNNDAMDHTMYDTPDQNMKIHKSKRVIPFLWFLVMEVEWKVWCCGHVWALIRKIPLFSPFEGPKHFLLCCGLYGTDRPVCMWSVWDWQTSVYRTVSEN